MSKVINKIVSVEAMNYVVFGCGVQERPDLNQALLVHFNYNYKKPPHTLTLETYLEIADYLRTAFYPYKNEDKGWENIGKNIFKAGVDSPFLGSLIKITARLLGMKKGSEKLMQQVKLDWNFTEYILEEMGDNYFRYRLSNVEGIHPAVVKGLFVAAFEYIKTKKFKVSYEQITPGVVIYEANWED